jgi:hypothetical protein
MSVTLYFALHNSLRDTRPFIVNVVAIVARWVLRHVGHVYGTVRLPLRTREEGSCHLLPRIDLHLELDLSC